MARRTHSFRGAQSRQADAALPACIFTTTTTTWTLDHMRCYYADGLPLHCIHTREARHKSPAWKWSFGLASKPEQRFGVGPPSCDGQPTMHTLCEMAYV